MRKHSHRLMYFWRKTIFDMSILLFQILYATIYIAFEVSWELSGLIPQSSYLLNIRHLSS